MVELTVTTLCVLAPSVEPQPQLTKAVIFLLGPTHAFFLLTYGQFSVVLDVALSSFHLLPYLLMLGRLQLVVVQYLLVLLDLVLDVVADLQFLLKVGQNTSSVQEEHQGIFKSLLIGRSRRDMNFALGEDRVLSVHQLVEKHPKRVRIVFGIFGSWRLFELFVVEIRHVSFVDEGLP